MRFRTIGTIIASVICLVRGSIAVAQYPIDIQREAGRGDYFRALLDYDRMPKRRATVEATLAAAKSAWALGLVGRATLEFDRALEDDKMDSTDSSRAVLSKGIIEYQEGRFQNSLLYADRVVSSLKSEAGPLKAKAFLLSAESLSRLKRYGEAEMKYRRALDDSAAEERGEVRYLLGTCLLKLGKFVEARDQFQAIPIANDRTPAVIRQLAIIAIQLKDYKTASFWLNKGRAQYPESFLDSWVDYALAKVAEETNDRQAMRTIFESASKKYPPSDYWFTLLASAVESFEWSHMSRRDKDGGAK